MPKARRDDIKADTVEHKGVRYYRYPSNPEKFNLYYRSARGKQLHRVIWEEHHGAIPDDCEIHHLDSDPTNNDISNLECLTISKHRSISAKARVRQRFTCSWCGVAFESIRQRNWPRRFCTERCRNAHNGRLRRR